MFGGFFCGDDFREQKATGFPGGLFCQNRAGQAAQELGLKNWNDQDEEFETCGSMKIWRSWR
jgi:hypothetical protein